MGIGVTVIQHIQMSREFTAMKFLPAIIMFPAAITISVFVTAPIMILYIILIRNIMTMFTQFPKPQLLV
jgi:hypothetical protein